MGTHTVGRHAGTCAGRSTKPLPVDPTMDAQRRCNGVLAINVTRSRTRLTADCCRAARRPRHRGETGPRQSLAQHMVPLRAARRGYSQPTEHMDGRT